MGKIAASETIKIVEKSKKGVTSFTVITLAVILILMLGAVRPTILTIMRISSEITQKREIYEKLNTKTNALAELRSEYNGGVKNKVEDLSLVYPSRGDFSLVMANLEKVCENNGFELISIGFKEIDKNEQTLEDLEVLKVWKAEISVKGPRTSLIQLMEDIEQFPMYPVIKSVSFSTETDELGDNTISISVNMYKVEDHNFYYSN